MSPSEQSIIIQRKYARVKHTVGWRSRESTFTEKKDLIVVNTVHFSLL